MFASLIDMKLRDVVVRGEAGRQRRSVCTCEVTSKGPNRMGPARGVISLLEVIVGSSSSSAVEADLPC